MTDYDAAMIALLRRALVTVLLPGCTLGVNQPSDPGDPSDSATTSDVTAPTATGELPTTGDATTTGHTTTGDATTGEPADILDQLRAIDGLDVEERDSPAPGYRYFVMTFMQAADHLDPEGLKFAQRLLLLHRDSAAPLVLATAGYFVDPKKPGLSEPSVLLEANQLIVEHRFFVPSRPDPADWSTLTIEQAAADLHAITGVFKPIYPERWLATGGSKGGMTAVYFRRFYPDDVDATIAYVAPNSYGIADPRYPVYLGQIGPAACREALVQIQREVLQRRPAMITRMKAEAPDGFTYAHLGEDRALETAVLELPFTFWQYGSVEDCAAVPDLAVSDDDLWTFLSDYNAPSYWSDYQFELYEPYFYQAAVQLGYPAYDEGPVADLLLYPGVDLAATYLLPDKQPVLDLDAMPDIADWLLTDGHAMLFIYGDSDPYTAAAFEPGPKDSFKFIVTGGNHGARILDLEPADRDQALAALAAWSGVQPKIPLSAPSPASFDLRRPLRASLDPHAPARTPDDIAAGKMYSPRIAKGRPASGEL